jgi:hypothetical protein
MEQYVGAALVSRAERFLWLVLMPREAEGSREIR